MQEGREEKVTVETFQRLLLFQDLAVRVPGDYFCNFHVTSLSPPTTPISGTLL